MFIKCIKTYLQFEKTWFRDLFKSFRDLWAARRARRIAFKKLKDFYDYWQMSDYQYHPTNLVKIYDDIIVIEVYMVPSRLIKPVMDFISEFFLDYYLRHDKDKDYDNIVIVPRTYCTDYTLENYDLTDIKKKYKSFRRWIVV